MTHNKFVSISEWADKKEKICMAETTEKDKSVEIKDKVNEIIAFIPQEREQEIISRRFGLHDHKETLEQIGELLGITRERVRQLEKAILNKLKASVEENKVPQINSLEKELTKHLVDLGRVSRTKNLAENMFNGDDSDMNQARLTFIAELAPNLIVISENDNYYSGIALKEYGDEKSVRKRVDEIVNLVKTNKQPMTADEMHDKISYEHPKQIAALASLSKKMANLKENWGLAKWPTVNPKNIRDKIYVVLQEKGKPMHFSDIADTIKDSDFKRKDVTKQAIHNELIKDKRFVLIGRGIYALSNWGFDQGTVADIIGNVLQNSNEPLHRDEIVRRVLKSRQVKETTILLNLQSKPQFKRVAKATYTYEAPEPTKA